MDPDEFRRIRRFGLLAALAACLALAAAVALAGGSWWVAAFAVYAGGYAWFAAELTYSAIREALETNSEPETRRWVIVATQKPGRHFYLVRFDNRTKHKLAAGPILHRWATLHDCRGFTHKDAEKLAAAVLATPATIEPKTQTIP